MLGFFLLSKYYHLFLINLTTVTPHKTAIKISISRDWDLEDSQIMREIEAYLSILL